MRRRPIAKRVLEEVESYSARDQRQKGGAAHEPSRLQDQREAVRALKDHKPSKPSKLSGSPSQEESKHNVIHIVKPLSAGALPAKPQPEAKAATPATKAAAEPRRPPAHGRARGGAAAAAPAPAPAPALAPAPQHRDYSASHDIALRPRPYTCRPRLACPAFRG